VAPKTELGCLASTAGFASAAGLASAAALLSALLFGSAGVALGSTGALISTAALASARAGGGGDFKSNSARRGSLSGSRTGRLSKLLLLMAMGSPAVFLNQLMVCSDRTLGRR
jgi:hypothetical protein